MAKGLSHIFIVFVAFHLNLRLYYNICPRYAVVAVPDYWRRLDDPCLPRVHESTSVITAHHQ